MKSVLIILLVVQVVWTVPLSNLYNFGEHYGDTKLQAVDEGATDELTLREPIVFYGETYFSIFVNANGLVSFLTEIPYFFNAQFPLGYPAIAPFYSDIDLTGGLGNIWYRETSDPTSISQVREELSQFFTSGSSFRPKGVFIVTWDGVGSYNKKTKKLNTFQLIIATDTTESYVIFKYATGGLQWLQGDGKTHGLPDALAQAGLIAEDGRFYSLKGSGTDQVRNLDRWTNTNLPGQWMFRIGQINPGENVELPDIPIFIPQRDTESCATGGTSCHSKATCRDYNDGFCCQCGDDYYGNGINCLKKDIPIRVTGKVTGEINGIKIEDADLHSYVLSSEGRTYTAVSKMPTEVGYDMQSLTGIGEGIAWLFAVPNTGVKNGFTLTGGKLNRTVEITFPQSGHKAFIEQHFMGVDVFNNVALVTKISGFVPSVPYGAELEVEAFKEEFTTVKDGQLRAKSQREFQLKGQSLSTPFSVETFIEYEGCSFEPSDPNADVLRMKVAENIFITFDSAEKIVRYSFSAKIGSLEEEDPCVRGREKCSAHSQCIVDGEEYRCLCEQGYDYFYEAVLNTDICLDVNECNVSNPRHHCHGNAQCSNSQGSYSCECRSGYTGDGFNCQPDVNCATVRCDPNAYCTMVADQPKCDCNPGYKGDGHFCSPDFGHDICHTTQDCSPYAICVPSAAGYSCRCLEGYEGDGYICKDIYQGRNDYHVISSVDSSDPHDTKEDEFNQGSHLLTYEEGYDPFSGSPNTFNNNQDPFGADHSNDDYGLHDPNYQGPFYPAEVQPTNTLLLPDPYINAGSTGTGVLPECILGLCYCPENLVFNSNNGICEELVERKPEVFGADPICGAAKCTCESGYLYEEILNRCLAIEDVLNAPLAICYQDQCLCPSGYSLKPGQPIGDEKCIANHLLDYDYSKKGHVDDLSCDKVNICHLRADCVYDDNLMKSVCVCQEGYSGDGKICTAKDECSSPADCPTHSQCVYQAPRYTCRCEIGFEMEGSLCVQEVIEPGCNVLNNCDANARCGYDGYERNYICRCNDYYDGDGIHCTAREVACNYVNNCGQNSDCIYDFNVQNYTCTCRQGFKGDGFTCIEELTCDRDPSMCHESASCYYSLCTCNPGLHGDGVDECLDPSRHESGLLIMNQGLSVLRMAVDGRGGSGFPIHVDPFMTAVGADVDCLKGRYYWTDMGSKTIRSSKYDGSDRMPIATQGSIGSPEDVAIDWISGNVYWTDSENDVVSVADLKSGIKRTVVKDGLVNPRGIAVHPGEGILFWSDWNRDHPMIESSGLDGSNRKVLVDTDIALPNSLVFDFLADNLCWGDAGTHKIECVGPHGRRVVAENIQYPFGITIFERSFFYTDWKDKKIHQVNIQTQEKGEPRDPPLGGSGKLYGIAAVPRECPNVSNRCQQQRGGCPATHLCLPTGQGHGRVNCACPDNMDGEDGEGTCRDFNI